MGVSGIAYGDIAAWIQTKGLDEEDATFFEDCIRAMDNVYTSWVEKSQDKDAEEIDVKVRNPDV